MRALALLALLVAAPAAGKGRPKPPPEPAIQLFDEPAAALRQLLLRRPRVVAFGEYHETTAGPKLPSAIHRFTEGLLPPLPPTASDLVVETWVTDGKCGGQEQQAVAEVAKTTERPATTEDEVVTLLKRAKARQIQPHILTLSCAEYQELQASQAEGLDYAVLLRLIGDKLRQQAIRLLGRPKDRLIVLYGGALHNDRFPKKELARFTFGGDLAKRTRNRYLEIDLLVPEYVEANEALRREPWLRQYQEIAQPQKTVLVRRGEGSYLLWFPRSPPPTLPPSKP